jgi:acyl carrier protein
MHGDSAGFAHCTLFPLMTAGADSSRAMELTDALEAKLAWSYPRSSFSTIPTAMQWLIVLQPH